MLDWLANSAAQKVSASWIADSKAFCVLPWVHLHLTQHGTVTPCCQTPWQAEHSFGNANEASLEAIWQGKPLRSFRKAMLRDQKDSRCQRCYEKEASGWTSLRQISNEKYAHKIELIRSTKRSGRIPGKQPVYLDIRFSNLCNLKCRICGPWSSSQWFQDAVALGMTDEKGSALTYAPKDKADLFRQLRALAPELEEIYFAGGEPLLMEEHYELLDLLIECGNTGVHLQYNSNFSVLGMGKRDAIAYWKKFPNVRIAASLDGSGARGEYLRKNLNWTQVIQNRERLGLEAPHVEFFISPTVCIFNLIHLPDFHREWVEKSYLDRADFFPSLLIQPEPYNIRVLPQDLKNTARQKINLHLKWMSEKIEANEKPERLAESIKMFQNLLTHLDSADHSHLLSDFQKRTAALDTLRKETFKDIFPELTQIG